MMDDSASKLAKALRVIETERAERARLAHELKMVRLDNTRLRHAVVALQRQHARKEAAHAGS